MLEITIPAIELWDERSNAFNSIKEQTLCLEHSLVSLSKWESKWNKIFLSKERKTTEETIDYIRCMTITKNVDPMVYKCLTPDNYKAINEYIEAPMTATKIFTREQNMHASRELVSSELIYYWMITFNIPFECQKWHLNRLITLIKVCMVKNTPSKKMSKREIMEQNAKLNAARRKKYNTRG